MRPRLPVIVVAVVGLIGFGAPELRASCLFSTPMLHGLSSYFLCGDFGPNGAYAYQQSNPAGVNTGTEEILCVAPGGGHCVSSGSGIPGDGRLTIETDWAGPGIIGCPTGANGPQRVMIVVSSGGNISGSALIVSISGADPDFGYIIEMAHPFDQATGTPAPVFCGTTVQQFGSAGGRLSLRFTHPPIYTDCDPGSVGALFLETCPDAFSPTLSFGQVYTQLGPCSSHVELRREFWTATGVVPGPDGSAEIILDASPPGYCTLVGGTTVVDGVETGIITGFALSDVDCTDTDGDGYTNCQGDCNDHDAAIHPGAAEVCNNIDDNCDARVDEGFDRDNDAIGDCLDNCPNVPNITQADRDGDSVGDVCDNCLEVFNPDQRDTDFDRFGDICDVCPTVPDPTQNPCFCNACPEPNVTISFSSPLSKGSGLVTWNTSFEIDLIGFNIVEFTKKGERIQLNMALIRCEECVTGLGHIYTYILPKHQSGRNIFIEMLRLNGTGQTFGPAQRVP